MIINLSYLEEITGGDKAMILEMLDLFICDIPAQVEKIQEFYETSDLVSLSKEAHKLKPTLQYIGLTGMFEDIKEIEQLIKTNINGDKLPDLVKNLNDASIACLPALKAKKEELS